MAANRRISLRLRERRVAGRTGSAGRDAADAPSRRADLACVRGGREVFSGLGFAVGAGEALAVTGPNGAGKSSLLRMIAGLVRAWQAGGSRSRAATRSSRIGEQAHYLGHQDALKPSLSVRENLALLGAIFSAAARPPWQAALRRRRPRPARRPAGGLSFGRAAAAAVARAADRGRAADLAARRADLGARCRGAGDAGRPHARRISPAAG